MPSWEVDLTGTRKWGKCKEPTIIKKVITVIWEESNRLKEIPS